ncbi:MAG TPA: M20/M25/M40 family metallo-hydrolase [Solirubrobacterales bacterium]|nr:M20/M25/M40 family metallo-hydrolase [Solirubrobacterales bacterium]
MPDDERILDRFVRLCEIPSPTGAERAVANAVLAELRDLGVEATEDGAAGPARAGAGNLIGRIPGQREAWVMFACHLDTVPHPGAVEVILDNGVFRSRGETILGADNKAAVTVLVELAARHSVSPPPIGLELVFTVAEEDGLRGAKELDLASLRSSFGFVIDHASPIGEVISAAPTYKRLDAEFEGHEAHAGIRPEEGRNAIRAAASAIAQMELGRIDDETTANVGVIAGGTASNVVPRRCRVEGEARSLDEEKASTAIGAMVDACTWAAGEHECDVDVEVTEMFRGYRLSSRSAPVSVARTALERCGVEPREAATGGGSDANALAAAGFECVLLANGTEANHTPDESVAAERIGQMLEVCEAIVREAAARC